MVSRTATSARGVRAALLAIIALLALVLGIVAMHASMVQGHNSANFEQTATVAAMQMTVPTSQMGASPSSHHAMGDMNLADCFLLGMICFLAAIAVLIIAILSGRIRSLLRPRMAEQSLAQTLRWLRPPEPPSLLDLSISRT